MSSITLEPRTLGPTLANRPVDTGAGALRDRSTRADGVAVRPSDADVLSRWDGVAEFARLLAGILAVYAFLIVLPLLALIPIVAMGLFLGVVGTLFSGIV